MININEDTMQIHFDPTDWKGMFELMQNADKYSSSCFGENKDGERVVLSINKDNITTQTYQNNGWMRTNVYWNDYTDEELYERYD